MEQDCRNCEYSWIDCIFEKDSGEEYCFPVCQNGNDISLDYECKDFKKAEE